MSMSSFVDQVASGQVIDPAEMSRVEKLYEEILLETSPNQLVARNAAVYAEALLNVAERKGQAKEVGEELDSLVHGVFKAQPEFEKFLANPAIHRKRKMDAIDRAFTGKCSPLFEDFLRLLCRHDRMTHLRLIEVSYKALQDRVANRVRVLVQTAYPLDKPEEEKLTAMLRKVLNKEPVLVKRVDKDLLGGVLLHVGDKVFDSTVRSRLETLRKQLLARGSHEIQSRRDRFSSNV